MAFEDTDERRMMGSGEMKLRKMKVRFSEFCDERQISILSGIIRLKKMKYGASLKDETGRLIIILLKLQLQVQLELQLQLQLQLNLNLNLNLSSGLSHTTLDLPLKFHGSKPMHTTFKM